MVKEKQKYEYEQFLELPEIVKLAKPPKATVVLKPDISLFSDEQLAIFKTVTNIKTGEFSQSLLTGYSGTGKSYLVSKIIEEIIFSNKRIHIAITAPTNKAVRVLKNLSSICESHNQVSFKTLHSLLGLKRVITYEGKEEFKADYGGGEIDDFDIIIVDEVSMLDNGLYSNLIEDARRHKVMVLFIGDRGQIPPVNGGESLLFTYDLENNFNLSKIIRQAKGSPIITLAQKIRDGEKYDLTTNVDENKNGVIALKINTEMVLLEKYFHSENFKHDPDFVKVLAWTNKAVDYYNNQIRGIIYGKNCGRLCVGEKMVCNKPITNSKKLVLLNNNDEFEVMSFDLKRETTGSKFWFYSVKVRADNKELTIKLLAENSELAYTKELSLLETKAKNSSVMTRRNAWVKYYNLLGKFADVKYNYALTVHKSQGSTFDNAIVINCDIKRIMDKKERNKLLYTAITRAKNKLFII